MNRAIDESHRIQPHHLERTAYVTVRQSSLRQVTEHRESRRRQYERVEWAVTEGWPRERIEVIDECCVSDYFTGNFQNYLACKKVALLTLIAPVVQSWQVE